MSRPNRPTSNKAQAGTDRLPTQVAEQLILVEVPPPNEALNEDGQFWWSYYCGLMIESQKLSRYFIPHIHIYCMVLQNIDCYEKKLKEDGYFIDVPKTFKGEEYVDEVPNPITKDLSKLYDQADRLGNSLGFTPYSAQIQGMDTGVGSNQQASEPPPLPDNFTPETLLFAQA